MDKHFVFSLQTRFSMIHALTLACLLAGIAGVRHRRSKAGSWSTRTDSNTGACAGHVSKEELPIYFPLYCSGDVSNLKFRATARGRSSPRLRLSIGGSDKGYRTFPIFPATRTWEVSHSSLSAGVHILRYSGDRLEFKNLEVTGSGAGCSLENAPGYNPASFTNSGLDVITRVVGSTGNNFSDSSKRQMHFAHEIMGSNSDGSISSTAISDGVWEWMYMYSKEQAPKDHWLSYKENGGMYEESDMLPYMNVSLDQLPGRIGEDMTVVEPCNTLSNTRFNEAAVWTACQGYPFTKDEAATLMAGFSFTGAGSLFFHASATSAGHLADVYAMDILMYTIHQIIIRAPIAQAGDALTQADKDILLYMGKGYGLATEKAKELTTLFRQPYDREAIWNNLRNRPPNYVLSICTLVLTVAESMAGRWPIPGMESLVNTILNSILDLLSGGDIEWVKETYRPVVQKTFRAASYCGDRSKLAGRMFSFAITFVEAFVFQEELIPVPSWVRDAVNILAALGLTADSDMRETWDIYNGQTSWCHNRSPHATWHEKAAHGLLHISNVAALMVSDVRSGSC